MFFGQGVTMSANSGLRDKMYTVDAKQPDNKADNHVLHSGNAKSFGNSGVGEVFS